MPERIAASLVRVTRGPLRKAPGWREGDPIVTAELPAKSAVIYSNARHVGLHGGRGGGKSHAISAYLVIEMHWRTWRIVAGRQFMVTPLIWEHVNPYGRFDLDMTTRLPLI